MTAEHGDGREVFLEVAQKREKTIGFISESSDFLANRSENSLVLKVALNGCLSVASVQTFADLVSLANGNLIDSDRLRAGPTCAGQLRPHVLLVEFLYSPNPISIVLFLLSPVWPKLNEVSYAKTTYLSNYRAGDCSDDVKSGRFGSADGRSGNCCVECGQSSFVPRRQSEQIEICNLSRSVDSFHNKDGLIT